MTTRCRCPTLLADRRGLHAVSGPCAAGFACPRGAAHAAPAGEQCRVGHYCPRGTAEGREVACAVGTLNPQRGGSFPRQILAAPSPAFVPGLPTCCAADRVEAGPYFVPGSPHVMLIELRQALNSYQDHHMLLLTLAGGARAAC